jgi:hypothetical protein
MAVRSKGVITLQPKSSQLRLSGTTEFVWDWWRIENLTTDDDASSPIHLSRLREAKVRKVRGLVAAGRSNKETVSDLRIFDIHRKAPPREHLRQTQ